MKYSIITVLSICLSLLYNTAQSQQTEEWLIKPKYKSLYKLKGKFFKATTISDNEILVKGDREYFVENERKEQQLKIISFNGSGIVYKQAKKYSEETNVAIGNNKLEKGYFTFSGKEILEDVGSGLYSKKPLHILNKNNNSTFVTQSGKFKNYQNIRLDQTYHERIIISSIPSNSTEKKQVGIIDWNGNEIAPMIYQNINPFSENCKFTKFKQNDKYGIIDYKGKIIVPAEYEESGFDKYGPFSFKKGKNYFVFSSKEGTLIELPKALYQKIGAPAKDVVYWRVTVKEKDKFVNKKGLFVIPETYEYVSFGHNKVKKEKTYFIIKNKKDKHGVIDQYSNIIVPLKYDNVGNYFHYYRLQNRISKNEEIFETGVAVIKPAETFIAEPGEYEYVFPAVSSSNFIYKDKVTKKFGVILDYKLPFEALWDTIIVSMLTEKILAKKGRSWFLLAPKHGIPLVTKISDSELIEDHEFMSAGYYKFRSKGEVISVNFNTGKKLARSSFKMLRPFTGKWKTKLWTGLKYTEAGSTASYTSCVMKESGQVLAEYSNESSKELNRRMYWANLENHDKHLYPSENGEDTPNVKWFISDPNLDAETTAYIDVETARVHFKIPSKYRLIHIYDLRQKIYLVRDENDLVGLLKLR